MKNGSLPDIEFIKRTTSTICRALSIPGLRFFAVLSCYNNARPYINNRYLIIIDTGEITTAIYAIMTRYLPEKKMGDSILVLKLRYEITCFLHQLIKIAQIKCIYVRVG